jgi:hypothetical protein
MKYLKRLNESFDKRTLDVLDGFGITKEKYLDIINFLGKFGYTEIKYTIPFIEKMYGDNPDYTIGYDEMRRLLNFYEKKKKEADKLESVEDYFLDLIEGDSDIRIEFKRSVNEVSATIFYNSLSDLSSSLLEIERRFKRANINFEILHINSNRDSLNNELNKESIKVVFKIHITS